MLSLTGATSLNEQVTNNAVCSCISDIQDLERKQAENKVEYEHFTRESAAGQRRVLEWQTQRHSLEHLIGSLEAAIAELEGAETTMKGSLIHLSQSTDTS